MGFVSKVEKMPRVLHVRSYDERQETRWDATALCRGGSRSELNNNERETPRGKRVVLKVFRGSGSGNDREVPRDKPVASFRLAKPLMFKRLLTPALMFVILSALGCERKLTVQESDKTLFLRAVDLVPYGFKFENIERYETFTKVRSIDGSYDVEYEFELPDTEDKLLYMNVTVSVSRKKSDAKINEGAGSIALRYALKAKGIEEEQIPNFYSYGDASSFYLLKKQGKSVGNYFTVREGNKTYTLVLSGMYFDDPALWKKLIEPKLKLFSAYKPA